jgi:hypothetical protein
MVSGLFLKNRGFENLSAGYRLFSRCSVARQVAKQQRILKMLFRRQRTFPAGGGNQGRNISIDKGTVFQIIKGLGRRNS